MLFVCALEKNDKPTGDRGNSTVLHCLLIGGERWIEGEYIGEGGGYIGMLHAHSYKLECVSVLSERESYSPSVFEFRVHVLMRRPMVYGVYWP